MKPQNVQEVNRFHQSRIMNGSANDLLYQIEEPKQKLTFTKTGRVLLKGWCWSRRYGAPIQTFITIGDRVVYCNTAERLDVLSRFRGASTTTQVGFCANFNVGGGIKLLHIQAKFSNQEVQSIGKRLIYHKKRKDLSNYRKWIKDFDHPRSSANVRLEKQIDSLRYKPLVSIILPVANVPSTFLKKTIRSVREQSYQNWQLCIAIGHSDLKSQQFIQNLEKEDSRIIHKTRPRAVDFSKIPGESGHDFRSLFRIPDDVQYNLEKSNLSCLVNSALSLASGEFCTFLNQDDLLHKNALASVVDSLNSNLNLEIIYSDEDKIDELGNRHDPIFKPAWNPDLLISSNYLSRMLTVTKKIVATVGGFREDLEAYQDWDYCLKATEKSDPKKIYHVPKILYHVRSQGTHIPNNRLKIGMDSKEKFKVLTAYIDRNKVRGEVVRDSSALERIKYFLPKNLPKVSIIIPTRDQLGILKTCIDGILKNIVYANYTITILDNNSELAETHEYFQTMKGQGIRVLSIPGPFNFSKLVNVGVASCSGELLLLLNNDIEAITSGWLDEMVRHALRPGIGVVGAKLLYPNGKIQHAGVILGIGGVAGHAFRYFDGNATGPLHRLTLVQNYSAVTGACMLFKRCIFDEVGGFEEQELPVAFNDVDFCLRVLQKGYRNLFTPTAELIHHESYSRGKDDTPEKQLQFQKECKYMKKKWGEILNNDPAYNPNLTKLKEDFGLGIPPC